MNQNSSVMTKPPYRHQQFPHWCTIAIRFRDLDPLNHVNNAIFSTFYEEARIHFIHEVPALADRLPGGFSFVLAHLQIDFIRPVTFPAQLLIGSGVKDLGNTSITSFQAIYHSKTKKLISVAESTGVWFNVNQQQPAPIPEIENIKQFVVHSD